MKDIANILNPPPAEPEEPLGAADLPGSTPLALPAAEAHTIETPAGKIAGETAAPVSPVSLTTSTDSGAVPASGTTAVEGPETEVTEVESAAKPWFVTASSRFPVSAWARMGRAGLRPGWFPK